MPFTLVNNCKKVVYSENPQRLLVYFAYAKVEGEAVTQLHHQVLCRDFLGDTLIWNAKIKNPGIYHYDFTGEVTPTFVVYGVKAPENLAELHKYEEMVGMKPSAFDMLSKDVALIRGDEKWLTSTFHVSWWTFLIRTLLGEAAPEWLQELRAVGVYDTRDPVTISKILKNLWESTKFPSVWPVKKGVSNDALHFHGNNGFVTYLKYHTYFGAD